MEPVSENGGPRKSFFPNYHRKPQIPRALLGAPAHIMPPMKPPATSLPKASASAMAEAMSLSVNGFVNDLVREFPMEYSVELKRLIDLEMEGSVG